MCLLRTKCFNNVCLQIALRWLQFYFCIMIIIVFLEYTPQILQCIISFLKINCILYLEMSHFEAETLTLLHSVCSSKDWEYVMLLSYTNHLPSGSETLQKKLNTVFGHFWNMRLIHGQRTCCSETYGNNGNIHITATKASLLCSGILIFSHRSQHMTEIICLSSIWSFVRTG